MDRYQTPDGKIWFEIYPGKLVQAYSLKDAEKLKDQGREGSAKNYIRNMYGPLKKL